MYAVNLQSATWDGEIQANRRRLPALQRGPTLRDFHLSELQRLHTRSRWNMLMLQVPNSGALAVGWEVPAKPAFPICDSSSSQAHKQNPVLIVVHPSRPVMQIQRLIRAYQLFYPYTKHSLCLDFCALAQYIPSAMCSM